MSMSGWSTPEDMGTWMNDQRRQTDELSRRVRVPSAKQILGPGLGPWAVRLFDWNDEKVLYNGVFYSEAGATNSPDGARAWIGSSWATQDGRGTQEITEIGSSYPIYRRTFSTAPGATPVFTPWYGDGLWVDALNTLNMPNVPMSVAYARHKRTGNTFTYQGGVSLLAPGVTGRALIDLPAGLDWGPGVPYLLSVGWQSIGPVIGTVRALRQGVAYFQGDIIPYSMRDGATPARASIYESGSPNLGGGGSAGSYWRSNIPVTWEAGDSWTFAFEAEIAP